jgi:hypothetical protein
MCRDCVKTPITCGHTKVFPTCHATYAELRDRKVEIDQFGMRPLHFPKSRIVFTQSVPLTVIGACFQHRVGKRKKITQYIEEFHADRRDVYANSVVR